MNEDRFFRSGPAETTPCTTSGTSTFQSALCRAAHCSLTFVRVIRASPRPHVCRRTNECPLLLSWGFDIFCYFEVREGMLALWLWSFVLSFVFFGGLAFIFWSGRYVSGSDAGNCSLAGGEQRRQDGGNTANPPMAAGSSADGSAPQTIV